MHYQRRVAVLFVFISMGKSLFINILYLHWEFAAELNVKVMYVSSIFEKKIKKRVS